MSLELSLENDNGQTTLDPTNCTSLFLGFSGC